MERARANDDKKEAVCSVVCLHRVEKWRWTVATYVLHDGTQDYHGNESGISHFCSHSNYGLDDVFV